MIYLLTDLTRALERIAELEANADILCNDIGALIHQRDEALARLAKYEPPVDPDLVLARKIAEKYWEDRKYRVTKGSTYMEISEECALAGIKADREAAPVKL